MAASNLSIPFSPAMMDVVLPMLAIPHLKSPSIQSLCSRNAALSSHSGYSRWNPHRSSSKFGFSLEVRSYGRTSAAATPVEQSLPPASKEEAVEQAGAALWLLLEKSLKQQQGPMTLKQRKALRQIRLRLEIPVLEKSPSALLTLASELLTFFLGGRSLSGSVAVFLPESALPSSPLKEEVEGCQPKFLTLDRQEDAVAIPPEAVAVVVIAPTFAQVGSLEAVVKSARARPVVVVNPEWSEEEEGDKRVGAFLASFCVAYSFIPLNIQGFFSKTEGAVVKNVRGGAPQGSPWVIFVKEGGRYKAVKTLKKKPTSADLENALYASVAANSPVSKSIVFLRGLVNK